MITVFYDGKCGLCRREIDHYKRIAPQGVFEWVDITIAPDALLALGVTFEEGLMALHVRDADGTVYKGADGFRVVWLRMPHWRWLGHFIGLPLIRQIARFLYQSFARWRYRKEGYGTCPMP